MKFSTSFSVLSVSVFAALMTAVTANPITLGDAIFEKRENDTAAAAKFLTFEEMQHWLATTDAKLTYVGDKPINALSRSTDAAQITTVTYCNNVIGGQCGGDCTVYTGGATCLNAPGTQCLAATNDVAFCSTTKCTAGGDNCNIFSQCVTTLPGNFCYTPGTNSILTGPY